MKSVFFFTSKSLHIYQAPERKKDTWLQYKLRCQSHVMKVLFLVAEDILYFDNHGNCMFNNEINIWPFVMDVQAEKSSKIDQQAFGKPSQSILQKSFISNILVNELIPAVMEKWFHVHSKLKLEHDQIIPTHI